MAPDAADLIVGRHPVAEALRAGVPLRRLFLADGMRPSSLVDEIMSAAAAAGLPVSYESRSALTRRAGAPNHQGVVAEAAAVRYRALSELLAGAASRLVLVEGITDPANLGSILRSAEAFGWHGVLVPERRAVGITPAVRKVAAGAAERVPVARTGSPAATVRLLQEHRFSVIGLDPAGRADYHDDVYAERTCLVVGAEGSGLSRLVRERCDETVRIPMRGAQASINAAVAAAIVMAEAARRMDEPSPRGPTMA
jgi:23S rRNA (guanosine2251-2'-O)-methyltransferase